MLEQGSIASGCAAFPSWDVLLGEAREFTARIVHLFDWGRRRRMGRRTEAVRSLPDDWQLHAGTGLGAYNHAGHSKFANPRKERPMIPSSKDE